MSIGDELASAAPRQVQFAGFWRRIAAALVDSVLLAALGWAIGHFFYDQLVAMGQFGRAIGFPIELAYFGVLNSRLAGGASLGKRALGIRVVSRNGSEISLPRSFWRAAVLILPLYLNGFDLTFLRLNANVATVVVAIDFLLVFGVGGASIYLYLANWQTRQVMHDLAAGTFVVTGTPAKIEQHVSKIHIVIVLGWLALTALAAPLAAQFVSPSWKAWFGQVFDADYDGLLAVQSLVSSEPDILNSSVSTSTNTFVTYGKPAIRTTFFVVTATLRRKTDDPERVAGRIAAAILKKFPDIMRRDKLSITVRYGYETGIWSMWNGYSDAFTPGEWRERISQKAKSSSRRP
jgi:uncharacterized RDD family membrane protein YckC